MSQPIPTSQTPSPRNHSASTTRVIVKAGASFEGVLTCRQPVRIDGKLRGDVVAHDRVELGENAEVSGRIEALNIVVAGRFEGELRASRCIELLATARVTGEFCARELVAEEGCMVEGRCRTGPASGPAV